jgi:hypothetical protein
MCLDSFNGCPLLVVVPQQLSDQVPCLWGGRVMWGVKLMWVIQGFVEGPFALFDVRIRPLQASIRSFKRWLSTQKRVPATLYV